jgi:class 3 adenylate cyclase
VGVVDDEGQAAGELEAAGLYDSGAADAHDRLEALRLLMEHGATVEDLVAARDELGGLAARLVLRPGTRLTWREVAERADVPLEQVGRIRRAAGFADSDPDSPLGSDAEVALMQGFAATAELFGEDMVLQLTRVIGSATARIADALVSTFVVGIGPAAVADDPSGLKLVRANLDAVNLLPVLTAAIDIMLRGHMVALQRPLADVGLDRGAVETQRLAVGFVDLVGSTALARALTTKQLGAALTEFEETAADCVVRHGGRVVKLIGDEIMFVVGDPVAACAIALDLVIALEHHAVLPRVRGGLAVGDVLTLGGDCFGPVVNLAARVVKEADPGGVVVDPEIRRLVSSASSDYRFDTIGERALVGFDVAPELAVVTREASTPRGRPPESHRLGHLP